MSKSNSRSDLEYAIFGFFTGTCLYKLEACIQTMNINVKNLWNFIACFAEKKIPKNIDQKSDEFLEGPEGLRGTPLFPLLLWRCTSQDSLKLVSKEVRGHQTLSFVEFSLAFK